MVSVLFGRHSFRYPLAAIILSTAYPAALPHWPDAPTVREAPAKGMVVLSYNVRLFDLYNWNPERNTTREILQFLTQKRFDIVCLQEFYSNPAKRFDPIDSLRMKGNFQYIYASYAKGKTRQLNNGLAILSKYNIVNSGSVKFDNTYNFFIYTDLVVNHDTVRVYNAHFESIHLSYTEYQILANLYEGEKSQNEQMLELLHKIRTAFRKRVFQVNELQKHADTCHHPVILCTDLNDTPMSYAYNKLRSHYADAWLERGSGLGSTYNSIIPFLRIDYIMHSPHIKLQNFEVLDFAATDHYPIQATFQTN